MQLTKHHGLGNDFLVLLDLDGVRPLTRDEVVAVCDRTTGVGADGLVRARRGSGTDLLMQLVNADGSTAEMSGNGISCLGQAALMGGVVGRDVLTVTTGAGTKRLELIGRPDERSHTFRVDMGPVTVGDEQPEWLSDDVLRAVTVDAGNPHLVLHVADLEMPDLEALGRLANSSIPGGANVELLLAGPGDGEVTMKVYERGVGLTDACGTGACAVATAAHAWELAPERVTVRQPGGPAVVEIGSTVHYSVTVESIASIRWPWP